jgi:glycosyltransferase involved in cell wall biosynthesis
MILNPILLSVLIPVRNEPESAFIIGRVLESLLEFPHELLFITDDASDQTVPVIRDLSQKFPNIRHVENQFGRGALNAVRAGAAVAKGKHLMIYAADEIGPVLAIPKMLELLEKGCEFVSGTRYAKGGKRYGGSLLGHILSRSANALFNIVSSTALTDCTTGLKMFQKGVFDRFTFDPKGTGWSFAFEMAIQAQVLGLKLGEVPIVSIDRLFGGQSSMRLLPWIRSYLRCFSRGTQQLPPWYSPRPRLEIISELS